MRILLVNDDGPPAPHSPHVLGLYEEMRKQGWEVAVVLPSSQKSWGSMAFTLHPPCAAWYYYPLADNHDGTHCNTASCWSATRRPVQEKELGEWILVDGSPTTCANIGLHSLHTLLPDEPNQYASTRPSTSLPHKFDLVVSGPNFGRNTGTAFSLCSGTIGAALAASLSNVRAISISYAHFFQANKYVEDAERRRADDDDERKGSKRKLGNLPDSAPEAVVRRAHELSVKLIARLQAEWEAGVGVYTVNVPLTYRLLDDEGPQVYWTRTWDSKFGPLFELEQQRRPSLGDAPIASSPGFSSGIATIPAPGTHERELSFKPSQAPPPSLALRFAPDMAGMLQPQRDQQTAQTDIWAILHGHISVARLNPSYTAVGASEHGGPSTSPGSHFKL